MSFSINQLRNSVLSFSVALMIFQTDTEPFEIMEAVDHFRLKYYFLADLKTVRFQWSKRAKITNDCYFE